jgi:dihydrofolate reductase
VGVRNPHVPSDARQDGGDENLDDEFAAWGDVGIGATIMGRNMFGPIRGPWAHERWTGWWGDDPPYHHPVFVLTHHPRASVTMQGGTTFHFRQRRYRRGARARVRRSRRDDVRLGGGAATIQQYLRDGLIDEMHLAIVPILLGKGERLFDHLDGGPFGYECVELVASQSVVHVRFVRSEP